MHSAYIIGFGKLGSHLYYALKQSGNFNNVYIKKSRKDILNVSELKESKIIFICTEDKNVLGAVKTILFSDVNLSGKVVYHTSGALKAGILKQLKRKGADIASFHPVQTFEEKAKKYNNRFKNISIALEGEDKAVNAGEKIALKISSYPFRISSRNKVLHHICCVEASNYIVSHFKLINNISAKISIKGTDKKILKNGFINRSFFDIYKPLILQTLQNISKKGITESLTGPIERNDIKTVELHLKTLKKQLVQVLPHYIIMGIETVNAAFEKRSLNEKEADKLLLLLKSYKK
jgi:predicted short-subunit dehydrogenase-like oxidoreductase (DUF2520 family)